MHRSLTLARRGLQQWRDTIKAAAYCLTGRVASEALRSFGTKPVGFGDQLRVVHLRAPPTGPSPQARRRIKTPGTNLPQFHGSRPQFRRRHTIRFLLKVWAVRTEPT